MCLIEIGGDCMLKEMIVNFTAKHEMTLAEFARKARISRASLYRLMRCSNASKPRTDTLGKIANVMGVEPCELLKSDK